MMMSHEEARELLPWFVNGSLSDDERSAVASHVDSCLLCHRIVQRERALLAQMVAEPDAEAAVDHGFRKLMRQIGAQPQVRTSRLMLREPRFAASRWSYAALMLLALTLAVWLATPRNGADTPAFTTVTDPPTANAHVIDIVFHDDVGVETRAAIAAAVGGRIIAGPSAAGRYELELTPEGSGDTVERALEQLRNDARVQFVARSAVEPSERDDQP